MESRGLKGVIAVAVTFLFAASGFSVWIRVNPGAQIIIGHVPLDEAPRLSAVADDFPVRREPPRPSPAGVRRTGGGGVPRFSAPGVRGLWPPNGRPPGPAKAFTDSIDDSGGLAFVLVLGSDARSGNPAEARSDSIHILAVDSKARRGTIVGIPRDSWVDIPGRGKRKINEALNLGGPDLAVRTVRNLTGLPITYYILTAFEGFQALVEQFGGVDAYVPYDMNDDFSGAYFQRGWHRMDGGRALAFTRNRHVPAGDFARSENQGRLMIDTLKKVRAATSTRKEIEALVGILTRHTRVNGSFGELVKLAVIARVSAASNVKNFVASGSTGSAGGASVVFLNNQAFALFKDVADNAFADGSYPTFGPAHPTDQGEAPAPSPPSRSPEPVPSPSISPII